MSFFSIFAQLDYNHNSVHKWIVAISLDWSRSDQIICAGKRRSELLNTRVETSIQSLKAGEVQ